MPLTLMKYFRTAFSLAPHFFLVAHLNGIGSNSLC